jgi:hypothetical protein
MFVWKLFRYDENMKEISFGPKVHVEMIIKEDEINEKINESGIICNDVDIKGMTQKERDTLNTLKEIFGD